MRTNRRVSRSHVLHPSSTADPEHLYCIITTVPCFSRPPKVKNVATSNACGQPSNVLSYQRRGNDDDDDDNYYYYYYYCYFKIVFNYQVPTYRVND